MFDVYEERDFVKEPTLEAYEFGSRVYGTHKTNSDADYIIVVESNEDLLYQVKGKIVDITVYSEKMFINAIKQHKINVLECIFQGNDEYLQHFELNLHRLRQEISSVTSNSWVKCKKKLKQGDIYVGLKSLFHSLRILMFGIQIAKHGAIVDYTEANKYLDIIMDIGDNWDKLNKEIKPVYNSLKTEFRKLAPMEEI